MAVTAVQPGEKAKEKSSLENAALLLGIGAQLGQLGFSAYDAKLKSDEAARLKANQPPTQTPAQPPVMSQPMNYDPNPAFTSRG